MTSSSVERFPDKKEADGPTPSSPTVYNGVRRQRMNELLNSKPVSVLKPDGSKQTITILAGGLVEEAMKLGGVLREIDGNPVVSDTNPKTEQPQNKP